MRKYIFFIILILISSCRFNPPQDESFFHSTLDVSMFAEFKKEWDEFGENKPYSFIYSVGDAEHNKTTICVIKGKNGISYSIEKKNGYTKSQWKYLKLDDARWENVDDLKQSGLFFSSLSDIYAFVLEQHKTLKSRFDSKEYFNAEINVDLKGTSIPYRISYGYHQKFDDGPVDGDGNIITVESVRNL